MIQFRNDDQACMVIDQVTGKPERWCGGNAVVTKDEAIKYIKCLNKGSRDRMIIIKLLYIRGV